MNIEHRNVTIEEDIYKELKTTLNTEDFIDKCYEKTRYNALRDYYPLLLNTLISYQISSIKKEIEDDKTAQNTSDVIIENLKTQTHFQV